MLAVRLFRFVCILTSNCSSVFNLQARAHLFIFCIRENRPMNTAFIPVSILRDFVRKVFMAHGVADGDAEISADVLIAADLRGIDTMASTG